MDVKDVVNIVEASKEFKDFIKANPENYLVHMFAMVQDNVLNDWQAGYYSKEIDKITIFDYKDKTLTVIPPQDAFKEKNYIEGLKLDIVKISEEEAMDITNTVIKDNYSAESVVKIIILLQNLPEFGQIWNMTVVTGNFSVLNIKIDASTGKVIKHTRESLMGWKKE